ncbi:MAG: ECF transporter S component [Clostridia bacterium]|nr:ECF transporter S component [Clostridia bacterium]
MQIKEKKDDKVRFTRAQLLTINALLCAIIVIFLIFPAIGPVKLAFIPIVAVIISTELIGLKNGIFTGFFFGLVSFAGSYISPSLLSYAFHNPLISVLPRVMIGIAVYFAAHGFRKMLPKLNPVFSYAVGSAVAVITNTLLVLGMILLFHFGTTFTFNGASTLIGWQWIATVLLTNSVIELAICTVITPPIIVALKRVVKKGR